MMAGGIVLHKMQIGGRYIANERKISSRVLKQFVQSGFPSRKASRDLALAMNQA